MKRGSPILMALGALILCGGVLAGGGRPQNPTTQAPATQAPALRPAATFQNPVIDGDFPDPEILRVGKTYYAYSTNAAGSNTPTQQSSDLVNWKPLDDALPELPKWATPGNTWAPSVMAVAGGYRLYFTARHTDSGRQCIGVAASQKPEGPFVSASAAPLVCQLGEGGSIDAQGFTDVSGAHYLYWKSDGNCCGLLTGLWVQPLSADGLKLSGKPSDLLYNGALWEGNLIEAPTVYRHAGRYYLFYSAAAWDSDTYAVGYAVSASPTGPFKKAATNPLLSTLGQVAGPGGQGVIEDGKGRSWLYYHAWTSGQVGYAIGGERSLRLDPLKWTDGVPSVRATTRPQPAPARP
jgi:beta-xylosidase